MSSTQPASAAKSDLSYLVKLLIALDAHLYNAHLLRSGIASAREEENAFLRLGAAIKGAVPSTKGGRGSDLSPTDRLVEKAQAAGFASLATVREPLEDHLIQPVKQVAKEVLAMTAAGALDVIEDVVIPGAQSLRVGLDACVRSIEHRADTLASVLRVPGAQLTDIADSLDSARRDLSKLKDQIASASSIVANQRASVRSRADARRTLANPTGDGADEQLQAAEIPKGCKSAAWYVQAVREFRGPDSRASISTTQLRRAANAKEFHQFQQTRGGTRVRYLYPLDEVCGSPSFQSLTTILQRADVAGFVAKGRSRSRRRKAKSAPAPSNLPEPTPSLDVHHRGDVQRDPAGSGGAS